jgi:hypothetical protein
MLDHVFIDVGHDGLHDGVMTTLGTLYKFQAVCDEPRCRYSSPTSNIKKRFDS